MFSLRLGKKSETYIDCRSLPSRMPCFLAAPYVGLQVESVKGREEHFACRAVSKHDLESFVGISSDLQWTVVFKRFPCWTWWLLCSSFFCPAPLLDTWQVQYPQSRVVPPGMKPDTTLVHYLYTPPSQPLPCSSYTPIKPGSKTQHSRSPVRWGMILLGSR